MHTGSPTKSGLLKISQGGVKQARKATKFYEQSRSKDSKTNRIFLFSGKMAEVGSLSSKAEMAMKAFVKCVFTIFATNASFLRCT